MFFIDLLSVSKLTNEICNTALLFTSFVLLSTEYDLLPNIIVLPTVNSCNYTTSLSSIHPALMFSVMMFLL